VIHPDLVDLVIDLGTIATNTITDVEVEINVEEVVVVVVVVDGTVVENVLILRP
jgi:hypothetical protein